MDCTQFAVVPTAINTAFAVWVLWILLRSYWQCYIDRKFGCSRFGGRAGHITIRLGGRTALVDFELACKPIDLIVYSSTLRWIGVKQQDISENDRISLTQKLKAWCKASHCKIELASDNFA